LNTARSGNFRGFASAEDAKCFLHAKEGQEALAALYGGEAELRMQPARYGRLAERFTVRFPGRQGFGFFSAPGRAEIGGNHTDHQAGRVLAAAVNLDTLAVAAKNDGTMARIYSEGYAPIMPDLADLSPRSGERGRTAAVVRGCAARMQETGCAVSGFDAVVTSDVLAGSGLSSSAAFEVLTLMILDGLFGRGELPEVTRAQMAQYAENVYFGKPSGLMDQMASSVGKLVAIDFGGETPEIRPIPYDFYQKGYALAVVNTGGGHGDLTDEYAAIRREMEQVAVCFGEARLGPVDPARFEAEFPSLRGRVNDRALLRAAHFFDENARVARQVDALLADDLPKFLSLVVQSGESSLALLQNLSADPHSQPLPFALELSRRMLAGCGAWRVHGGGFAGTILAFVPLRMLDAYRVRMDTAFGAGACRALRIRPVGPVMFQNTM
jgi:galactokinase